MSAQRAQQWDTLWALTGAESLCVSALIFPVGGPPLMCLVSAHGMAHGMGAALHCHAVPHAPCSRPARHYASQTRLHLHLPLQLAALAVASWNFHTLCGDVSRWPRRCAAARASAAPTRRPDRCHAAPLRSASLARASPAASAAPPPWPLCAGTCCPRWACAASRGALGPSLPTSCDPLSRTRSDGYAAGMHQQCQLERRLFRADPVKSCVPYIDSRPGPVVNESKTRPC